jgi:hypothetical protein
MSSCILCGLPLAEPSREHVIPQWARREFDIRGKVTIESRKDEASTELRHVGSMQHLNVTLDDAICKDCNTVWLNRALERPLQPVLAPWPAVLSRPSSARPSSQRSPPGRSRRSSCSSLRFARSTPATAQSPVISLLRRSWPGCASTGNRHHARLSGSGAGTASGKRRSCTHRQPRDCRPGTAPLFTGTSPPSPSATSLSRSSPSTSSKLSSTRPAAGTPTRPPQYAPDCPGSGRNPKPTWNGPRPRSPTTNGPP